MKLCPFCGCDRIITQLDASQGDKRGYAKCVDCDAKGPEVRTDYSDAIDAKWRQWAMTEWDIRA
jgi:hypothetical protein